VTAVADGRTGRILVVDDEADIRTFIRETLVDEGYEVDLAGGGAEALRAVEANRPDLIMLDVNMPDVDGWDVLAQLRAAAGPQTPVVVMTAGYNAQDQALASGAQGYLGKPFDLDDLLSTVAAHASLPMVGAQEAARVTEAGG
jgi:two-component system, chemotaxis family, chemotaxis protein CheY